MINKKIIKKKSNNDPGAVSNSLLLRVWQGVSILITLPLLLNKLDGETQGLYYFFLAIASTQAFFEMGLGLIITIRAGHEWIHLRINSSGSMVGDELARAKLRKICLISLKFTLSAAAAFLIVCIIAGTQFVNIKEVGSISAYFGYVLLIAIVMILNSLIYVLEGSNNVGEVAKFRLITSIIGVFTLWMSLQFNAGIFSLVFQASSLFICTVFYILFLKRNYFISIYAAAQESNLSWRSDFLPQQWRLGLQSLFNMLSFPFFQFISFKMLGAVESGKLGLTLQLLLGIQTLSLVFIRAKIPHLSMLAARAEVALFRSEWVSQFIKSLVLMSVCFIIYIIGLAVIAWNFDAYYNRLLGFPETLIFCLGLLATSYIFSVAAATRAYKIEKFTLVGVFSGLGYSTLSIALCQYYGNAGIALAYSMVSLLFVLPASHRIMKKFAENYFKD